MEEVKSLRVLVFTAYFWPENFRINELVLDLASAGHKVYVVTGYPNYPSGTIYPEFKKNKKSFNVLGKVNICRVPCLPRGKGNLSRTFCYLSFVLSVSVWVILFGGKKNFDAAFVYAPSPITVAIPAIIFKFFYSRPILLWVLDLWPETLEALALIRDQRVLRFLTKLVGKIYKSFDHVFGQSQSFVENIAEKGCERRRVSFLGSWSDETITPHASKEFSYIRDKSLFTITFAGNIGLAQDIPSILRAAELLKTHKNIRFLFVGSGSQLSYLREFTQYLGLDDKILSLGQLPITMMPEIYSYSDALLVSLKKESVFAQTIPGKIQSCLYAGKPILGMLDGDGAEVIVSSKSGLVAEAGDYRGLSSNILKMVEMDKIELDIFGMNGREFYKQSFSRKISYEKIEDKLIEVVKAFDCH
jgi:colanic acid biosynthesis glycosyl transferase WcaI